MFKSTSSIEEVPYCFSISFIKFRDRKSLILTRIEGFRTVPPVWFHRWLWNDAQSLMWYRRGALLVFKVFNNWIKESHNIGSLSPSALHNTAKYKLNFIPQKYLPTTFISCLCFQSVLVSLLRWNFGGKIMSNVDLSKLQTRTWSCTFQIIGISLLKTRISVGKLWVTWVQIDFSKLAHNLIES